MYYTRGEAISQWGILSGEPAEKQIARAAVRLPFAALTGYAGVQVAQHAAQLAHLSIPAVHDAIPRLRTPSGSWPVEPEAVSRARVRQQLGAMVRPSGLPLFSSDELRRLRPQPEAEPEPAQPADEPAWADLPAGLELAEVVDDAQPRALDVDDLVRLAQAHVKLIAHHEAGLAEAMAAMTRRSAYVICTNGAEKAHDRIKAVADEISVAMMWTPAHADTRVRTAVELHDALPATLAALRDGRIDTYKARIIADETTPLLDQRELRARVESAGLAAAARKSGPQLRAYVKKEVMAAAPELAEQRRKTARRGREVARPVPECDGMGSMSLRGPIEDLVALFTAVDAAARARKAAARKADGDHTHPDASASLDALRFDVLTGTGWSALSVGHLGCCNDQCAGTDQRVGAQRRKAARVHVVVPFTSLIGMTDAPAELPGYGPVTAEVARKIAAQGTWRRLLTDPTSGALLDFGTTRYEPPDGLADFVIARDRTCRFPPCNWTAEASQLDHTEPHRSDGSGGATADYNLGAWHDRHHNSKTSHGWVYRQPERGRFVMISPAGLTYEVDPEVIGPIFDQLSSERPEGSPTDSRDGPSKPPAGSPTGNGPVPSPSSVDPSELDDDPPF